MVRAGRLEPADVVATWPTNAAIEATAALYRAYLRAERCGDAYADEEARAFAQFAYAIVARARATMAGSRAGAA